MMGDEQKDSTNDGEIAKSTDANPLLGHVLEHIVNIVTGFNNE